MSDVKGMTLGCSKTLLEDLDARLQTGCIPGLAFQASKLPLVGATGVETFPQAESRYAGHL